VNFFEDDYFGVLNGYLAPNLWPPRQRQDMLDTRKAVTRIINDFIHNIEDIPATTECRSIFDPHEGAGFVELLQQFLITTEQQTLSQPIRPAVEMARNPCVPPKKAQA
jgi:hypothetical protein